MGLKNLNAVLEDALRELHVALLGGNDALGHYLPGLLLFLDQLTCQFASALSLALEDLRSVLKAIADEPGVALLGCVSRLRNCIPGLLLFLDQFSYQGASTLDLALENFYSILNDILCKPGVPLLCGRCALDDGLVGLIQGLCHIGDSFVDLLLSHD